MRQRQCCLAGAMPCRVAAIRAVIVVVQMKFEETWRRGEPVVALPDPPRGPHRALRSHDRSKIRQARCEWSEYPVRTSCRVKSAVKLLSGLAREIVQMGCRCDGPWEMPCAIPVRQGP